MYTHICNHQTCAYMQWTCSTSWHLSTTSSSGCSPSFHLISRKKHQMREFSPSITWSSFIWMRWTCPTALIATIASALACLKAREFSLDYLDCLSTLKSRTKHPGSLRLCWGCLRAGQFSEWSCQATTSTCCFSTSQRRHICSWTRKLCIFSGAPCSRTWCWRSWVWVGTSKSVKRF